MMSNYQDFDAPERNPAPDLFDARQCLEQCEEIEETKKKYLCHIKALGFAEGELAIAAIEYEWGRVPFVLKWDKFGLKLQRAKKVDHKEAENAVGGNLYQVLDYNFLVDEWAWFENQIQSPKFYGIHIYPTLRTSTAKEIKGVSGLNDKPTYFTLTTFSAKQFKAVWFECDDQSKREQIELIEELKKDYGITPALVVDTAGKSLHSYYRLLQPITQEVWLKLQKGLIARCKSDPNLFRFSGSMRLAGSPRRKEGQLLQTQIIHLDETAHIDPNTLLAHLEPFIPKEEERKFTPRQQNINLTVDERNFEIKEYVPLEEFLGDEYQNLLSNGLPAGSRFFLGQKFVGAIKSIENGLIAAGIPYIGSSADLIEDLCSRSNCPKRIKNFVKFANKISSIADTDYLIKRYKYLTGQSSSIEDKQFKYATEIYEQEQKHQAEREEAEEAESSHRKTRFVLQELKRLLPFARMSCLKRPEKKEISNPKIEWQTWSKGTFIQDKEGIGYIETETLNKNEIKEIINQAWKEGFYTIIANHETGLGKTDLLRDISVNDFYDNLFRQKIELIASERENLKGNKELKEYAPYIHFMSQSGECTIPEINETYLKAPVRKDSVEINTEQGIEIIKGNCAFTEHHKKLFQNGIEFNLTGYGRNPVCQKCPAYLPKDQRKDRNNKDRIWCGNGDMGTLEKPAGYLNFSSTFWGANHSKIRSTATGFPEIIEKQNLGLGVIDEVTAIFKTKQISFGMDEINKTYYAIRQLLRRASKQPELIDDPIIKEIADNNNETEPNDALILLDFIDLLKIHTEDLFYSDDFKGKKYFYGIDHDETTNFLIRQFKEHFALYFAEDQKEEVKKLLRRLQNIENNYLNVCQNKLPDSPSLEDVEKLPRQWMVPLLRHIFGLEQVGLNIKHQKLFIDIINPGLKKIGNFAGLILLDASAHLKSNNILKHLEYMQKKPTLDENGNYFNKVLFIRSKLTKKENLKIEQFVGAQLETNDRSEKAQEKVLKIKEIEKAKDPTAVFIDHKKYCGEGDLRHQSAHATLGSRGSNSAYKKRATNFIQFGTPRPNRNSAKSEYYALGLDKICDFETYYNTLVAEEIIQNIGRPRANRRLDEKLTFKFFTDVDLSFLEDFGYNLPIIKSFNQEYPQLGNAFYRHINNGLLFIKQNIDKIEKFTCNLVSGSVNVVKSTFSEIIKPLGGFSNFIYLSKKAFSKFNRNDYGEKIINYINSFLNNLTDYEKSALSTFSQNNPLEFDENEDSYSQKFAMFCITWRLIAPDLKDWVLNDYPGEGFEVLFDTDGLPAFDAVPDEEVIQEKSFGNAYIYITDSEQNLSHFSGDIIQDFEAAEDHIYKDDQTDLPPELEEQNQSESSELENSLLKETPSEPVNLIQESSTLEVAPQDSLSLKVGSPTLEPLSNKTIQEKPRINKAKKAKFKSFKQKELEAIKNKNCQPLTDEKIVLGMEVVSQKDYWQGCVGIVVERGYKNKGWWVRHNNCKNLTYYEANQLTQLKIPLESNLKKALRLNKTVQLHIENELFQSMVFDGGYGDGFDLFHIHKEMNYWETLSDAQLTARKEIENQLNLLKIQSQMKTTDVKSKINVSEIVEIQIYLFETWKIYGVKKIIDFKINYISLLF